MEINMEGRAGQALLPGQSEQRRTEASQGRWLYELEQALLRRSDKKPAAEERPAEAKPEEPTAPGMEAAEDQRAGEAKPQAPAAAGGNGKGTAQPAAATAPADLTAASDTAPAASDALLPAAAQLAPMAAAGGALPAAAILAPAAQPTAATALPLSLAAYASVSGAGQRTAAEKTAAGVQSLHDRVPATAAGLNWLAVPEHDAAPLPASAPAAPEEDAAPATAAREQDPADDYAARLLHVYHGADGVQAWVRDAGIGAAQSLLLARGMADELNSAGSRLAALTVNGKQIVSGSDSPLINSTGAV